MATLLRLAPLPLLALAAAAPAAVQDGLIHFRAGAVDPVEGYSVPPGFEAPVDTHNHILQFEPGALSDERRQELADLGVQLFWFLPDGAFLARLEPGSLADVASVDGARFVGPLARFHRLDPPLVDGLLEGTLEADAYAIVLVDPDQDGPSLEDAISALGGTVNIPSDGGILVKATLTPAQLALVSERDEVHFIEAAAELGMDMDNARVQTGTSTLQGTVGFHGAGVRIYNQEGLTAINTTFGAQTWPRSLVDLPTGATCPGLQDHGTQVASEMWSDGTGMSSTGLSLAPTQGILPGADLYYTYANLFSPTSTCSQPPLNREAFTKMVIASHGIDAMNASWGSTESLLYTAESAAMDRIAFETQAWITQSQGNIQGSQLSRPEAWAKNVASVAGFEHFDNPNPCDDVYMTSSHGPAADGRIGVTFTAYDSFVATTFGFNGLGDFGGTSASAPLVCALGGVAIEMFQRGEFGYPVTTPDAWTPKGTTTKMLLATTSQFLGSCPSSPVTGREKQGWGFPNVQTLFDERKGMLVVDELDVLTQGASRTYLVFADGGELRVGLAYLDPAASPSTSGPQRVNSLDLTVIDPAGNTFHGNNGLLTGAASTPGGQPDDLDTEELVVLPQPVPGLCSITVSAPMLWQDGHTETSATDADFALVARGLAGMRDETGVLLSLTSPGTGQLAFRITNLPASFSAGWVLFSASTTRPLATGILCGVEPDGLTASCLGTAPAEGNPIAFVPTSNPVFPNVPFGLGGLPSGLTLDAAVVFLSPAGWLTASNVVRVIVQ